MSEQIQTVLIIDDDDAVRESLADFFEDQGWRVLATPSAEDALDILASEMPSCAVVDIRLPGIDGNEFIRETFRMNMSIPCVICTGSPEYQPPDDIAPLPQVFEKVFIKPVADLKELESALCQHIEKYSKGKEECNYE